MEGSDITGGQQPSELLEYYRTKSKIADPLRVSDLKKIAFFEKISLTYNL